MNILINADDFGWDESCSLAILESFKKNYINTTTAIPIGEFFDNAMTMIKSTEYKKLVGIHLDLTEGTPLSEEIKRDPFFCDENGQFHSKIDRYAKLTKEQERNAYIELNSQIEKFLATGVNIHHIDSHNHIHTAPYITPIVIQLMEEYKISGLRLHRNVGNINFIKHKLKDIYNYILKRKKLTYSEFFGSFDDVLTDKDLYKIKGTLEIMCHPDFDLKGNLIDRSPTSSYTAPQGILLRDRIEKLKSR